MENFPDRRGGLTLIFALNLRAYSIAIIYSGRSMVVQVTSLTEILGALYSKTRLKYTEDGWAII